MKNHTTHYAIVLDKSGSMYDCEKEAISSFNEQLITIQNLQKEYPNQDYTLSLVTFNEKVSLHYIGEDPSEIKPLNSRVYTPNGMTALYDGIGKTVKKIQKKFGKDVSSDNANVVVVIISDGYENSSIKYNHHQIQSMIKELESTGRYTFNYLGATIDAVEIAKDLSINESNALYFDKEDYHETTEMLTHSLKEMSSSIHSGVQEFRNFLKKKK